ncbi:acetyl-CoA acetyltransferase [Sphingobium chlorophenolicum L-1]|uniref:Acetyl-CoA acetyltransferase n=1 Tax=Sphingobium chlorophenolicum L-1 TaxID=690566 RepID=F6EUI6_SPHCR|nr:acetyl-CoA C-acetyltransferase [Sphingobium chlorophenolicum]AEG47880.1 acetyl-CoA acetyltransferase [Sphingobium chlorophenolicum L-1]
MPEAFIFDAVRTPRGRGRPDGSLHSITPVSLAAQVLEALRDRNNLDTSKVDDVVLGCVSPVGDQGADIARTAVMMADYAQTTSGLQIDRFCASGLDACNVAAAKVISGEAGMAIGGGVECMSRLPIGSDGGAWPNDPDVALKTYFAPQGIGADLIATLDGFTRADVDSYALESQRRAAAAWQDRRFSRSIIPVQDQIGDIVLDHDEYMRPDATLEGLSALKPAFAAMGEAAFDAVAIQRYPQVEAINHVHHAGNSSGIVDGAAGVLIGSLEAGKALGLKPRAKFLGGASIGSEPTIMLTAPADVARKLLGRLGMTPADIDLYELNEAFAAVVLRMMRVLDIPHDKMNVNGGAIAMGHPLGATGAMILGTVLDELERSDKSTALVSLCAGAGQGAATVIERV